MCSGIKESSRESEASQDSTGTPRPQCSVFEGCLCHVCREVLPNLCLDQLRESIRNEPHHSSSSSLRSSAEAGCYLCQRLQTLHDAGCAGDHEPISTYYRILHPPLARSEFSITLYTRHPCSDCLDSSYIFNIEFEADSVRALELARLSLSQPFTGHEDVLNLARYWLEQCTESHAECRVSAQSTWAPTRLLSSSGSKVHLIHTVEHNSPGPYATLSHCWGPQPFACLTEENMPVMEAGLDLHDFLPSFQHALRVSRALGIYYLWIDCYCIIQASKGNGLDWEKESKQMVNVYRNGVLNIGATHASNPYQGLFTGRHNGPACQKDHVSFLRRFGSKDSLMAFRLHDIADLENFRKIGEISPLFRRAWVMQERLLCRRMLHFDEGEIYWECAGHNDAGASEKLPIDPNTDVATLDLAHPMGPFSLQSWQSAGRDAAILWARVVEQYTKMKLTKPDEDKCRAIEAVMEQVSSDCQVTFMAGLLRHRIGYELLWYGLDWGRRRNFCAVPTWSWLSADGAVKICSETKHLSLLIEVKIIAVQTQEGNSGLPLHLPSLQICCRLLPCVSDCTPTGICEWSIKICGMVCTWHPDEAAEGQAILPTMKAIMIAAKGDTYRRTDKMASKKTTPIDLTAKGRETFVASFATLPAAYFEGIIVRQTAKGEYRRVAYFCSNRDWQHNDLARHWVCSPSQIITLV